MEIEFTDKYGIHHVVTREELEEDEELQQEYADYCDYWIDYYHKYPISKISEK